MNETEIITPQTHDLVFGSGEYEGSRLSEVYDVGYLEWLLRHMKEDVQMMHFVRTRLKELV